MMADIHTSSLFQASDGKLREPRTPRSRQQTLIDFSRDPIFVWDFEHGIVEWNRGCEELYGFSRAEALGKRKEELLKTVVPGSSFAALRAALLRDGVWSGEVRQWTKDGRELAVEARIEVETIDGRRLVLENTRDISERKTWERQQQLLLRELVHRVKNTLAVVQSIASQTLRNTRTREDFVERFTGRLAALAAAHGLMVQSEWKGADLEALTRVQLAPYASDDGRVRIEGPPLSLPPDYATSFGLVLHELATNAAKHGALSVAGGRVSVRWTTGEHEDGRLLALTWEEKGGPPPRRNAKSGLGTALIDKGIPNTTVQRAFENGGFVCRIELPLSNLADKTNGGAPG